MAEEFHDALDTVRAEDRDGDRRVQARAGGRLRSRKAGIGREVGRPGRLTACPDAAGKPDPREKLEVQGDLLELRRDGGLRAPYRPAAQHPNAFLVRPPRAQLPVHRVSELGQQPAYRLAGALSLGEHPRDGMPRPQQALGSLALGDVVQEGVEASGRPCPVPGDRQLDGKLATRPVDCAELETLVEHRGDTGVQVAPQPLPVGGAVARRNDQIG